MTLAALLPVLLAAGAPAQEAREPTLMVVRIEAPLYIGQPAICPGDTEGTKVDAESICLAELYQGRGRRVRNISGPEMRNGDPVRLTMSHMRVGESGGLTLLVLAVPFEDKGVTGNFAYWWMRPQEGGAFCMEAGSIARMEQGPVRSAFEAGFKRRSGPSGDFRCVHG